MSATKLRPGFRQRLQIATWQMWALHVVAGIARTVLAALVLVAATAAVDYFLELPFAVRATIFAVEFAIVAWLGARWIVRPARTWPRSAVVVALEGLYPSLGQRLRTVLEHGDKPPDELVRAGVEPTLVAALEEETAEKAKPLPFWFTLPLRSAFITAALAVVCITLLSFSADQFPEWQTALRRATLSSVPYTTLAATPSASLVDQGADVEIRTTLTGRARPAVTLHFRGLGEPDWQQENVDAVDDAFVARLSSLRSTTEFFVSAGPDFTPTQPIVVRCALLIIATRVEVKSPDYTGVALATHQAGSFSAVEGSTARFIFELDRQPTAAALVVKNPAQPGTPARRVEMTIRGEQISAEIPLEADLEYAIDARDSADVAIAPNRFRVRVTPDRPPTVWCDLPVDGIEVHSLAEVLIHARASDDFGISKIGIVFQVNNEDERVLTIFDVKAPCQRTAVAEQILMLEQFSLTEKDCVGYYAFAEDNRPGTPQRATTELRFIDIRPFRRTYQLIDVPEGGGGGGGRERELIFLDEVIARQRFNLNQTMRLETRSKVRLDLTQVERVAAFENKLATQARDLADFLAELGVDGAAVLTQAEQTMLSAVDSIQGAKFGTAVGQERDALRYLMEARNTARQALRKSPRDVRAKIRAFDRFQSQKNRRDSEKDEVVAAIAAELERLAAAEDDVARLLAQSMPPKDGAPANPASEMVDPLQERQDDIAASATEVDKVAAKTKELTGLARTRIASAAAAANAAADALNQKDRVAARKEVDRARELFRLAAQQVAALAAKEAAQQLAGARDIANEVANQTAPPIKRGAAEAMPGIGNAAEKAKTLKEVLEQIESSGAASSEAARQAAAALKAEDLAAATRRLEQPGVDSDRDERQDLAERFAALGQRLDRAYRELVAPRLEELARFEHEASELQRRFNAADDDAVRQRVYQQVAEFVERLDAARLGMVVGADLREGLKAGANAANKDQLAQQLEAVREKLVARLKQFVLGDQFKATGEAVPAQYKELVDRYLRALSAGSSK
jgi:hypothetical protein